MTPTHRRVSLLTGYLASVYIGTIITYGTAENQNIWDSAWWGLMTMTTVGYGDEYPHTVAGRIAGIILVMSAVFVVVPTITAFIASKFIVDDDAWTHDEQEQVKDNLKEILELIKNDRHSK